MPSTLSILINVFPVEERAKAIAIWASFLGASGAIGPPISGWLLGHFWYGSIFFVNVPIIVVALAAGWFLVPTSRDPEQARLDPVGAVLSVIGIVSLVYGLIEAPAAGWGSPATLGAFAVALVVLTVFAVWESRTDEPMLDISFFRNPAFSTATGGMILVFLGMYGILFLLTQYFQLVLGFSPLGAALRLLPMTPIMSPRRRRACPPGSAPTGWWEPGCFSWPPASPCSRPSARAPATSTSWRRCCHSSSGSPSPCRR
jgi:MFS family permease